MQHLYGVSFRGKMLYFSGSISDDRVKEVEEIANQIDYTLEEDAFCRQLGNAIRSKLGIEFNHQPVETCISPLKIGAVIFCVSLPLEILPIWLLVNFKNLKISFRAECLMQSTIHLK